MSTHDIELPQGYAERPFDYSGDLYIEGQVRAIIEANRALVSATLQAEIEALRAEVESERNLKADAIHACALANIRAERLAEALRELVEVFSESGMYDEEVFDKARAALAKENSND